MIWFDESFTTAIQQYEHVYEHLWCLKVWWLSYPGVPSNPRCLDDVSGARAHHVLTRTGVAIPIEYHDMEFYMLLFNLQDNTYTHHYHPWKTGATVYKKNHETSKSPLF